MPRSRGSLLIVAEHLKVRRRMSALLSGEFDIIEAEARSTALASLRARDVDLVLVEIQPESGSGSIEEGLRTLQTLRQASAPIPIVAIVSGDNRTACSEALGAGVYDVHTGAGDPRDLRAILKRALEHRRMGQEIAQLQVALKDCYDFRSLLGMSPQMEAVRTRIRKVAKSDAPVLIVGESGTGKQLIARVIHFNSPRREGPFVPVDCPAVARDPSGTDLFERPASLSESGRLDDGPFLKAHGGTVYLDEVGALPSHCQLKLLRLLERREIEGPDSVEPLGVDVRVAAAAQRNLESDVAEKRFRQDLYHRINTYRIEIPPLRDRREDIPHLVRHFLDRFGRAGGGRPKRISDETMEILLRYGWPGNVRELEDMLQSLATVADITVVQPRHLPPHVRAASGQTPVIVPSIPEEGLLWQRQVEGFERGLLEQALKLSRGRKTEAALRLGLKKDQMKYLCRKYGLTSGQGRRH